MNATERFSTGSLNIIFKNPQTIICSLPLWEFSTGAFVGFSKRKKDMHNLLISLSRLTKHTEYSLIKWAPFFSVLSPSGPVWDLTYFIKIPWASIEVTRQVATYIRYWDCFPQDLHIFKDICVPTDLFSEAKKGFPYLLLPSPHTSSWGLGAGWFLKLRNDSLPRAYLQMKLFFMLHLSSFHWNM